MQIEDISNYINEKNKNDNMQKKLLVYFYYLVIQVKEFQKNLAKILILSAELGITFIVFLYIENENDKILFHKNFINYLITIILVYSPEDIIKYLTKKLSCLNFHHLHSLDLIYNIYNIQIPKISFEQEDEEKFENGCFELAETFNTNLINNTHLLSFLDSEMYIPQTSLDIYNIYKDHNALDLFYKQNSRYFGFFAEAEFMTLDICFIKRILYLYCREEIESEKSFYRMINEDLRTRNSSKIYRNVCLLTFIYKLMENEELASYKGKVYRATKLDEKLIVKLVPGVKMVNTVFWSTSKDFNKVKKYMEYHNYWNSYIICNTSKNNIDIDYEKLNPFDEKEIFFLPFTEFIVKSISFKQEFGKKIYTIEVSEIGNRNFNNIDNIKIENANTFYLMEMIEKEAEKSA